MQLEIAHLALRRTHSQICKGQTSKILQMRFLVDTQQWKCFSRACRHIHQRASQRTVSRLDCGETTTEVQCWTAGRQSGSNSLDKDMTVALSVGPGQPVRNRLRGTNPTYSYKNKQSDLAFIKKCKHITETIIL